ncbi:hypothetical protein [Acinetobacter sp. BY484]|uniref:hypothetical protein n=1 Tax=Acinetobacter sp. BY484 TaxID=2820674 RepID=UPI001C220137|nr:hypothetical protein [Acinetobacter sp. BY484]
MLTQLVKQIWLVMLMVFAIGWSSVSVASAKTMHLLMPAEQINSHCLEMAKATVSHAQHESVHHQNPESVQAGCISDMVKHSQAQDCLDCSASACQSLITSLPIAAPELNLPDHGYPEKTLLPAYHAKHLAGYWQDILRPPKA